ncbi:MAG: hypothetical protein GY801_49100 [bacterium]|nr:hypothetical protein [bacterium]
MVKNPSKQTRSETPLGAGIRQELLLGMDISRDPDNAGLPDLFARITTMYSPWFNRTCPECKLKFREDDRVRLCPACGQAYHDDVQYELHCWMKHFRDENVCKEARYDQISENYQQGCGYQWLGTFPDQQNQAGQNESKSRRIALVTTQFLRGLEKIWTPFGEEYVYEVSPGDPIIGHRCPWCRFGIRAGDRVVKCPCGNCQTYFHDDIFRHLTCWNDWNGAAGHDHCPTTGARISR